MPVTVSLPAIGSLAPEFTLASTSGQKVTLSSFRGSKNVIIAFFPFAFTSTCTAELCDFSTDYAQFANADTVVLPISCDFVQGMECQIMCVSWRGVDRCNVGGFIKIYCPVVTVVVLVQLNFVIVCC